MLRKVTKKKDNAKLYERRTYVGKNVEIQKIIYYVKLSYMNLRRKLMFGC